MNSGPRIALVHDWLDTWRGGENVLAELIALYPQADLFALVDFMPDALRAGLAGKRATTSFLQHVPGARRHFRSMLPLFPRAIGSLDLSGYDLVISSSHAVAKGVRCTPSQLHICYCHTPMRYAWDLREQYLAGGNFESGLAGRIARGFLDRLRDWDRDNSAGVDHFVANSAFIRERIARCYGRDATVIHPPVDVAYYQPASPSLPPALRGYYLTASRFVPYKRIDLIAAAFRHLPKRRLIVVGEGPDAARIRAAAGDNVEIVDEVPRDRLRDLLREARAFVFAAEEDFGILPVEAQACGTPVIAYGRGGALETVRGTEQSGRTGVFFPSQDAEAIAAAVRAFEALDPSIASADCRRNADRFTKERFRDEFMRYAARAWHDFALRRGIMSPWPEAS